MNDFQILSKLGEGAYSVVYKVKRMTDGKTYALKKVKLGSLSEKEKQNALNEVRILASVKSSFVVTYKEAFYDENEQCLGIVMEFADKGDLYQKICEFKKAGVYFEESDIFRIFIQLVRGLKALHDMKILHRDLKSANVFLYNDGSAKLGDLNVSKVAKRGLGYTQTGTPYYASPEVWKDQPYDSKSDIWSLGCVLYEMITLRPPFRAENMEGLYNKVIKGQFSKIPEKFSNDLVELVKYLLQVQPENRPSPDQILKNPIIQKRMEFFKTYSDDMHHDNNLLQTIRIPKNLLFLTDRLPQANYEINKKKQDQKKKDKAISNNNNNNSNSNNNSNNADTKGEHSVNMPESKKEKKTEKAKEEKQVNDEEEEKKNLKEEPKNKDASPPKYVTNKEIHQNKIEEHNRIKEKYKEDKERRHNNVNKIYQINHPNYGSQEVLPSINRGANSNYQYNVKPQQHSRSIEKIKMIPYNDHISKVYNIYAPYLKNAQGLPTKQIKYNDKSLKNIEKYYEYNNIYKSKKSVDLLHMNPNKVIPNRKLSPIGAKNKIKMVKI